MTFITGYVLEYPNSFIIHQKYWHNIREVFFANTPIETTLFPERIVAIWRVKLKEPKSTNTLIVDAHGNLIHDVDGNINTN